MIDNELIETVMKYANEHYDDKQKGYVWEDGISETRAVNLLDEILTILNLDIIYKEKKEDLVKNFINKIKEKYPNINIHYSYNIIEDHHNIDHDYIYEFTDEVFRGFAGSKIRELYNNNFYNFCFAFDPHRELTDEEEKYLEKINEGE